MNSSINHQQAPAPFDALPPALPMEIPPEPRPRFLSTAEVKAMTGLKQTALYDLIKKGLFPKQVKQGRLSFWWEHEVVDYMKSLPRA